MAVQANWVDYKMIKEQVDMQMVLERYGVKTKKAGKNHVSCCPIHQGTNSRQFSINLERSIWQCFGDCKTGGNVLDFTAMMEFGNKDPSSIRRAALKLKNWFIPEPLKEEPSNEKPAVKEKVDPEENINKSESQEEKTNNPLKFKLKNLDPNHKWFETRGISPETVEFFGLGLQKKGKTIPNRIAIPIHDHSEQLVAYCGRAINKSQIKKEGKYKLPPNFLKSEVVYNLHRQPKDTKNLILVESYISVWKFHQMGFAHTIAIMGSQLSASQERLIADFLGPHGRLICMFDADEAGQKCSEDCLIRFGRKIYVKAVNISPYTKKPHQLTLKKVHACLCTKN